MKGKNIKLITEVTKIVTNILAKEGEVSLPTIGSFKVVESGEGQTLSFSEEQSYRSVVDEIASQGKCTEEQAMMVYTKWVEQIKDGEIIKIEKIGIIEGGVFTIDPALTAKVKAAPKATKAEEAKPSVKGWAIGATIFIAAIVALIAGGVSRSNDTKVEAEAAPAVVEQAPSPVTIEEPVVEEIVIAEPIVKTPVAEPTVEPEPEVQSSAVTSAITSKARFVSFDKASDVLEATLAESTSPMRYRVVCGVLNSKANAGRLILDIQNRTQGQDITCKAYSRNGGYMVTMFESDRFFACIDFIQETSSKLYDQTWVYDNMIHE